MITSLNIPYLRALPLLFRQIEAVSATASLTANICSFANSLFSQSAQPNNGSNQTVSLLAMLFTKLGDSLNFANGVRRYFLPLPKDSIGRYLGYLEKTLYAFHHAQASVVFISENMGLELRDEYKKFLGAMGKLFYLSGLFTAIVTGMYGYRQVVQKMTRLNEELEKFKGSEDIVDNFRKQELTLEILTLQEAKTTQLLTMIARVAEIGALCLGLIAAVETPIVLIPLAAFLEVVSSWAILYNWWREVASCSAQNLEKSMQLSLDARNQLIEEKGKLNAEIAQIREQVAIFEPREQVLTQELAKKQQELSAIIKLEPAMEKEAKEFALEAQLSIAQKRRELEDMLQDLNPEDRENYSYLDTASMNLKAKELEWKKTNSENGSDEKGSPEAQEQGRVRGGKGKNKKTNSGNRSDAKRSPQAKALRSAKRSAIRKVEADGNAIVYRTEDILKELSHALDACIVKHGEIQGEEVVMGAKIKEKENRLDEIQKRRGTCSQRILELQASLQELQNTLNPHRITLQAKEQRLQTIERYLTYSPLRT